MQFDDSKAGAFRLPFGCLSDVFHNGRRLGTQPPCHYPFRRAEVISKGAHSMLGLVA